METDRILFLFLFCLICLTFEPSSVEGRRSRGRSRGRKPLGGHRLPFGAKWKDEETAKYYEHPGRAKILKASHFDMEYSLGHKIYFMCIADGDPRPEIYWYKDGIEIYAHQHLIIHEWRVGTKKLKSKMEIDPATQRDQGIYDCIAHNKYAYDRRSFRTELDLD